MLATLIAGAAVAAIWADAVPRAMVCPAVYPGPDWCTPGARQRSGVTWTAAMVAVWALVVAVALTLGRLARWLLGAGVVVLAVVGIVGYRAVMGSTGYAIG
ncbi:hypothetical protein [Sanguibacter suaedae]|uniref:Uncharacterized protein n=1 Tax=Sanguibacter suaedae TaxID=2795737 RepID=A0A934M8M8_9MICO|nr:hypothetical protein [Sanguibacter suaedae]MBI9113725.1 hypothetical protein [Sanguibacter suaedae]